MRGRPSIGRADGIGGDLALWSKPKNEIGSTQDHLEISEIHEGIVITKTMELRAILMVSSINFSLKSEQEQNAIIYAFQNFLNSLNFPLQISMQSKKLDLGKYLARLKAASDKQTNELLRTQTIDYIDFIERLINIANIMDKKFFVTIPFTPPPKIQATPNVVPKGLFGKNSQTQNQALQMTFDEFNKYKEELMQRVQVVASGLGSIGMRSAILNTQQIIELFYRIYNPEEANKQKLTNVEHLTTEAIESELEKKEEPKEGQKDESK